MEAYQWDSSYDKSFSSGLSLIPKLMKEQLHLNSYSRMRVNLAAQVYKISIDYFLKVLNTSVANAFDFYSLERDKGNRDVCADVQQILQLPQCTLQISQCTSSKPDLRPYRNPDDPRLKVREHHLNYNNR